MRIRLSLLALAITPAVALAQAPAPELGSIDFPTSGAPAAQEHFLQGVKLLHSFEFDDAGEAFRRAQEADPDFAMAYWGEAMSYNHPLWAEQDVAAARKTLVRLGATRAERMRKAPTEREKGYLEALEVLYGEGDKLQRDLAYSEAMERLSARFPDDDEAAAFYALSLLGTVRAGDQGVRRQMLAASIVERIFEKNPNHPGAAHYLIHAFDDPEHAPLGLPAAEAYAEIAPAATHALHMPSHIFVQRGMWDRVAASNKAAFEASEARVARKGLSPAQKDFHSLSWLQYAALQLGQYERAQATLELVETVAREHPTPRVTGSLGSMRARYIIETEQWQSVEVADRAPEGAPRSAEGTMRTYDPGTPLLFAAGLSAARLGDVATADAMAGRLRAVGQEREAAGRSYNAKTIAIMEKSVTALARLAGGDRDEAVRLMKEATAIEASLDPPSGPPDEPIKPSHELFGEVLLQIGQPKAAAEQFEIALQRMPNRVRSLLGAARAAAKLGERAVAARYYAELARIWTNADPGFALLEEAQRFVSSNEP